MTRKVRAERQGVYKGRFTDMECLGRQREITTGNTGRAILQRSVRDRETRGRSGRLEMWQ